MSKKLFKFEIIGFIFVSVIGTLSHFLFEWFDENKIIGLFCPINESVWEHLKLLFFPYLVWSIAEYFILNRPRSFFNSKIKGIYCGMLLTVSLYYTFSGIIGSSNLFIDILSYFIGVAISFIISYMFLKNEKRKTPFTENISILLFAATSIIFFIFTFSPPLIPLFEDPQSLTYGI